MKRLFLGFIGLCIAMMWIAPVQAAGLFGNKKKTVAPAQASSAQKEAPKAAEAKKQEVQKVPEAQKKSIEAQKLLAQEKRKRLNNTQWQIELKALSGSQSPKEKNKNEAEVLAFKDNQISVQGFSKKGFGATNYTLTVQDDGSCVWETMQTSEKSGIAFWRGEIDKDISKMQGVLSYHIDDKTTRDYSFVSEAKTDIPAQPLEGK